MTSEKLPLNDQGLIELQEFVDPLYGSERYIKFKPEWLAEVEDKLFPLPIAFWRKYPVTIITLRNGRKHKIVGYWAEQLRAAMAEANVEPEAAASA